MKRARIFLYVVIAMVTASPLIAEAHDKARNKAHDNSYEDISIFVTNDDGTMSLVRQVEQDGQGDDDAPVFAETQNLPVGMRGAHWSANQYRGNKKWWWIGGLANGEILAFKARKSLTPLLDPANRRVFNTYNYPDHVGLPTAGVNFVGTPPNSNTIIWNAAREVDEIQEIDADPKSLTFGQVITHIKVPLSPLAGAGSSTLGRMRPCDVSITPNGKYLFEPDLGGDTVSVVDLNQKAVVAQIVLPRENPADRVRPFMLTTNGKFAIVDNLEAPFGSYSILDVTNPTAPVHVKKLTSADGIGVNPQTNEFTPDGRFAYLITNGSPTIPGVINVLDLKTLTISNTIALPTNCRPHAGDFSKDGEYFFVNCSGSSQLAVIDTKKQQLAQGVQLSGTMPRGVIVRY